MDNHTEAGMNRTGMQASPQDMKKMMQVTDMTSPDTAGDEAAMAQVRTQYVSEAEPVGSVPPPVTVKGAVKSTAQALKGRRPHVLIDRLGERLAFERTGTRIYDALIAKCMAARDEPEVADLDMIRQFRQHEAQHFQLVADCIERLGGDPTAQTPCADVTGVESSGLLQVVADPKTTVTQSLHAMLVAELADNAAWEELIALAKAMGQGDMAERFREPLQHERDHLRHIRQWYEDATLEESGAEA